MPPPPFGTASAYADSFPAPPPSRVTVSAETCFNLGVFRDMVKQYRRLDDQIITRLNRAQAQLRDQSRKSASSSADPREAIDGMCYHLWKEMMAGWAHRQTLLTYCLQTVTSSIEAKKPQGLTGSDNERLSVPTPPSGSRRGWMEEEVLADQLASEESVEAIIRKRTLEAFKSRCPLFYPASSDRAGKEWWDLADSGTRGRGPDVP